MSRRIVLALLVLVISGFGLTKNGNIPETNYSPRPSMKDVEPALAACQAASIRRSFSTGENLSSIFVSNVLENGNDSSRISDSIAYDMVFRLLSSHKNDPAKLKQLRAYVRQNLRITSKTDILAVFGLASEFKTRIRQPDEEIMSIKTRYHAIGHPPYSQLDLQRLATLKEAKTSVVARLIAEIPIRMSADGQARLNERIQEHVKAKIKFRKF